MPNEYEKCSILDGKETAKISGAELMTQTLSVCACRRGRAGSPDHDGVRIVTRYRMRARPALSQACRSKLHKSTRCTPVRAMQRGVSRQDAFLIPFANFADGLVWTAAWVGAAARAAQFFDLGV